MTANRDPKVHRILGIPVSLQGLTDSEARLRAFEPENPKLFVPRTVGAGWDLNVGALAVRLGLLRPDDSIPDLAEHIPSTTVNTLRAAPLVGAVAVIAAGVYAAQRYEQMPTNWGLTFRPTRWGSGTAAMIPPVVISVGAGLWSEITSRRAIAQQSKPTVDVTTSAQAIGLQALSLVLIAAAARQVNNDNASNPMVLTGVLIAPAVTTGVLVTTVRSALRRVERKLRRKTV